ncbi:MAG: type I-C CRISPR-associated protein Cas5 [Polyangiaceae bacterium]|nr:type I-C CRISPR-associated protein Cas5 [Polyangiaceae bacterium]
MVQGQSDPFRVRVRGELACFTRPEMKVERVSYEVMTPSAGRGILEAILWKPAIAWRIHAIEVLAPIRWTSFRRNEVQSRASERAGEIVADEDRTQRNTVALRDVDYVVQASFAMTPRAGAGDNVAKYVDMFLRRLQKGQHHHAPCLGCREFAAVVEPAPERTVTIDQADRPLGWMFFDFDWPSFHGGEAPADGRVRPLFFNARLKQGVLLVPDRDTVRAEAAGSS